jgi:hypothetical protein
VPANWYAALVVIVVIGLVSVIYSRYEYRHPSVAVADQPAVGTTWYAGIDFNLCGRSQASLPARASTTGITTTGNGVLVIAPTTASQGGAHATLGHFVSGYPGLRLTSDSVQLPGGRRYTNGDTCPAGTPESGKKGVVLVFQWPNVEVKKGTLVNGDALALKIGQTSLIGVAFAPPGTTLPKSTRVEAAVLQAASTPVSSATTTTVPATSTTTTTAHG